MTEIISTQKEYTNIEDTYKYAFIGIPKGFGGLKKPYFGTLNKFKKKYPDFSAKEKISTILFIHGSKGLGKGEAYRKWIVEAGFIFFAPNSFKVENRPTYTTPAKLKDYEKVHKLRQDEIQFNLKKLKNISFIDKKHLFLMGNSEGGLAAAAYKGRAFKGRIITAYSCENGYYSKDFKLGVKKCEPFLNIIGTQDEYFGKDSKPNKKHKVSGNCTQALLKYRKAKVVLLPQTKHDITTNIYVKEDIVSFLNYWSRD